MDWKIEARLLIKIVGAAQMFVGFIGLNVGLGLALLKASLKQQTDAFVVDDIQLNRLGTGGFECGFSVVANQPEHTAGAADRLLWVLALLE